MSILNKLQERSESKCELCGSNENISMYKLPPMPVGTVDDSIMTCATCKNQLENPDAVDANHWRCLNDSMWSEVAAVQVLLVCKNPKTRKNPGFKK